MSASNNSLLAIHLTNINIGATTVSILISDINNYTDGFFNEYL